jgi:hypothetical protein
LQLTRGALSLAFLFLVAVATAGILSPLFVAILLSAGVAIAAIQALLQRLRETFYDVLDETDDLVSLGVNPHRLKADIVERLLVLATDGTPQDEWKSKVLSSLSLR